MGWRVNEGFRVSHYPVSDRNQLYYSAAWVGGYNWGAGIIILPSLRDWGWVLNEFTLPSSPIYFSIRGRNKMDKEDSLGPYSKRQPPRPPIYFSIWGRNKMDREDSLGPYSK